MAIIQQGHPSYAPTGPGDRGQRGNGSAPHNVDVTRDVGSFPGEEPDLPDADETPPPEGGDEAAR